MPNEFEREEDERRRMLEAPYFQPGSSQYNAAIGAPAAPPDLMDHADAPPDVVDHGAMDVDADVPLATVDHDGLAGAGSEVSDWPAEPDVGTEIAPGAPAAQKRALDGMGAVDHAGRKFRHGLRVVSDDLYNTFAGRPLAPHEDPKGTATDPLLGLKQRLMEARIAKLGAPGKGTGEDPGPWLQKYIIANRDPNLAPEERERIKREALSHMDRQHIATAMTDTGRVENLDLRKKSFDAARTEKAQAQEHAKKVLTLAQERFANEKDRYSSEQLQELGKIAANDSKAISALEDLDQVAPGSLNTLKVAGISNIQQTMADLTNAGLTERVMAFFRGKGIDVNDQSEDGIVFKVNQALARLQAEDLHDLYGASLTETEAKNAARIFANSASYTLAQKLYVISTMRDALQRSTAAKTFEYARKHPEGFSAFHVATRGGTFLNPVLYRSPAEYAAIKSQFAGATPGGPVDTTPALDGATVNEPQIRVEGGVDPIQAKTEETVQQNALQNPLPAPAPKPKPKSTRQIAAEKTGKTISIRKGGKTITLTDPAKIRRFLETPPDRREGWEQVQ